MSIKKRQLEQAHYFAPLTHETRQVAPRAALPAAGVTVRVPAAQFEPEEAWRPRPEDRLATTRQERLDLPDLTPTKEYVNLKALKFHHSAC